MSEIKTSAPSQKLTPEEVHEYKMKLAKEWHLDEDRFKLKATDIKRVPAIKIEVEIKTRD